MLVILIIEGLKRCDPFTAMKQMENFHIARAKKSWCHKGIDKADVSYTGANG